MPQIHLDRRGTHAGKEALPCGTGQGVWVYIIQTAPNPKVPYIITGKNLWAQMNTVILKEMVLSKLLQEA